ncbi:MAG TPA: glycerol-3-phosphate 1-O-acyltransferase [candidate division Zixibacteria bacterium]|nr:glycerol-3-phosphate 1-O-acyltransferase [candidate division Zixibacteria bacterium]
MLNSFLALISAYLLGSIPFAIIMVRILKGVDVRDYGSKNAGATNVYRVAGIKVALLVGLLDLAKGFAAVYFIPRIFQPADILSLLQLQLICTVAVVLGHMFTIFANLKGGKGVLAAAGAFLALLPLEVGLAFVLFIVILSLTGYVSLGSICAALFLTLFVLFERFILNKNIPDELVLLSAIISIVVVLAHRSNIGRLIAGTENKIGKGSSAE